jgi:drug/metabolite transporter (DMT)-like permease
MKARMWLALLALYIAWGTTYLAIQVAIESIPPFFMAGARFLIAGLVLYIWRRLAGDPSPSRKEWKSAAISGTFMLVGGIGGVGLAEQYVPSGITALIIAATPLWVVLLEALPPLSKKPTRLVTTGVLIGLAGIIILVDPFRAVGQSGYSILGVIILLLAALSWAAGSIYSRRASLPKSAFLSTGMQLLVGSAGSILVGIVSGETGRLDLGAITLRSAVGLGYLVVVGSLIGFVCYTWLLRIAPTSLVMTYAYVNPLVAVVIGSLLANEAVTRQVVLTAPLILLAVALSHTKQHKIVPYRKPHQVLPEAAGDD